MTTIKSSRDDCLFLSIDNIESIENFVNSISKKRHAKIVSISQRSTSSLSTDEATVLFEAVGSLPLLETIQLRYGDVSIHYLALAVALNKARHLVQIDLSCVNIGVSDSDPKKHEYTDFLQSIEGHSALKEFKLSFSTFPAGSSALDSIVNALSNCPSIEKIQVYVKPYPTGFLSGLSCSAAEQLARTPSLATLKLRGIALEDEHVRGMENALSTNTSLRELRLMNCGLNGQRAALLSKMLKANTTLEHLDLSWNDIGDMGCASIANALEKNTALHGLYLHNDKSVGEEGFRALERMMENNFSLKTLWINISNQVIRERVEFYLQLNQVGKRHILRKINSSKDEWLDTLASHHNHPSGLFYYVSKNPLMFRH